MKVPTERVRDRLSLEVIVQTRQVAPARVASQLDQTGAEHVAKQHPSPDPDQQHTRRRGGCSKEDGEEARLEQQRLPSEPVENLTDVHKRQVEEPQRGPSGGGYQRPPLEDAGEESDRDSDSEPGGKSKRSIARREIKETGTGLERDLTYESGHRQQSALAEERNELISGTKKRDQIDERERSLEEESRDRIARERVRHRPCLWFKQHVCSLYE